MQETKVEDEFDSRWHEISEILDALSGALFGVDGSSREFQSSDEARHVLRLSSEMASLLHAFVPWVYNLSVEYHKIRAARIVAQPIAGLFVYIDEVIYAKYPELEPEELKGIDNLHGNRNHCVIERANIDALKSQIEQARSELREAMDI